MSIDSQSPIVPEPSVEATASSPDSSASATQPKLDPAVPERPSGPEQQPAPELNAQPAHEPVAETAQPEPEEAAAQPEPAEHPASEAAAEVPAAEAQTPDPVAETAEPQPAETTASEESSEAPAAEAATEAPAAEAQTPDPVAETPEPHTAEATASEESSEAPAAEAAAEAPAPEAQEPAPVAETRAEKPSEAEAAESPMALEELIEQYSQAHQAPSEGEIFEGRVIEVTDIGIVVDIGGKAEGLVPAQEFVAVGGVIPFVPGQTIEVQSADQEKEGYKVLSYLRAHRRRVWDDLERAYRSHEPVHGPVVERIKGGLVIDIGVRAFLPASHADLRQVQELESWIGQDITCLILKMNRKRGNVVVSRRALLEQELSAQRQKLLETLQEDSVVVGKVKSITDYGIFVDLGGLDGLVHVTDLSWTRIKNPAEFVSIGQDLEVKVLKFDREKMRVSLGCKQLTPDPWEHVPEHYAVGTRMHGTVVGITDYGAFVELESGVEGLVHVSEMTWSRRTRHPSKIVSIGDLVEVVVLDLKPESRRISLGLKQTLPDPWETVQQKYPVGTVVAGRVRNLTDFGAFVELEEGVDGLIHVSDISWTERVQKPSEKFKKGDLVQAKVLKIDTDQRRISLGIKQMNDIWGTWFASHHVNEIVRGKVARLTPFGAFVELAEGIEGLCHISEVEDRRSGSKDDKERQARLAAALEPGQEYDFKVIKIDPEQRRIGLSLRGAQKHDERKTIEAYRSSGSSPRATIADAILAKRGSL